MRLQSCLCRTCFLFRKMSLEPRHNRRLEFFLFAKSQISNDASGIAQHGISIVLCNGHSKFLCELTHPVTGDGMGELTKKFAVTIAENDRNTVLSYPGSIVAYLRFREEKELEPSIVAWFKAHLAKEKTSSAQA